MMPHNDIVSLLLHQFCLLHFWTVLAYFCVNYTVWIENWALLVIKGLICDLSIKFLLVVAHDFLVIL